jgi:hypothetical protein
MYEIKGGDETREIDRLGLASGVWSVVENETGFGCDSNS